MARKKTLGLEVKITFWDHVHGSRSPIQCVVYGKVIKETKTYLVLAYWDILDQDHATISENGEPLKFS